MRNHLPAVAARKISKISTIFACSWQSQRHTFPQVIEYIAQTMANRVIVEGLLELAATYNRPDTNHVSNAYKKVQNCT